MRNQRSCWPYYTPDSAPDLDILQAIIKNSSGFPDLGHFLLPDTLNTMTESRFATVRQPVIGDKSEEDCAQSGKPKGNGVIRLARLSSSSSAAVHFPVARCKSVEPMGKASEDDISLVVKA